MNQRDLLSVFLGTLFVFILVQFAFYGTLTVVNYEHLWQLTAPKWLINKSLLSVVLSYHAQPPGMLILQWLATNVTPDVVQFSLAIASGIYICCFGLLAAIVFGSRAAGILAAIFIALHPSSLMYAHWFFSPIYLAACLSLSVLLVFQWVRTGNGEYLAWALVALALASIFHAAYLIAFILAVVLAISYRPFRRAAFRRRGFYIPFLAATAMAFFAPAKNYVIFDFLGPSSWAPLNLASVYTRQNPWKACETAIVSKRGATNNTENIPNLRFNNILDDDLLLQQTKPSGTVNFNNFEMLNCRSRVHVADNFNLGATRGNLLRAAFEILAVPSWDYPWLGKHNLQKMRNFVKISGLNLLHAKNPDFHYYAGRKGRPAEWLMGSISVSSLILSGIVLICSVDLLQSLARTLRKPSYSNGESERRERAVAFCLLTAMVIVLVMALGNGQELNRMRFSMSPLFLVVILEVLRRRWPDRLRSATISPVPNTYSNQ